MYWEYWLQVCTIILLHVCSFSDSCSHSFKTFIFICCSVAKERQHESGLNAFVCFMASAPPPPPRPPKPRKKQRRQTPPPPPPPPPRCHKNKQMHSVQRHTTLVRPLLRDTAAMKINVLKECEHESLKLHTWYKPEANTPNTFF
jgi:hypothetical protein